MIASAHLSTAPERQPAGEVSDGPGAASHLWLQASDDGWALVSDDGTVIFKGIGLAGRHECLERAHDLGVLAVFG
jgi:hypothetical protein